MLEFLLWLVPAAVLRFVLLRRPLGKLGATLCAVVVFVAALLIYEGRTAHTFAGGGSVLTWMLLRTPARGDSTARK
jgi:hypothetical protein